MTIGATELDRFADVHIVGIGLRVAADAAGTFGIHITLALGRRGVRCSDVLPLHFLIGISAVGLTRKNQAEQNGNDQ